MEKNGKRTRLKRWLHEHPVLCGIFALQTVFLLFLLSGLFRMPYSVRLTAQNFAQSVPTDESGEYQATIEEEALRITVRDDVKEQAVTDDTNQTSLLPMQSAGYALQSGAYEVRIQYQTDSTSPSTDAAILQFSETRFTNLVYAEDILLTGGDTVATGRLWVPMGANAEHVIATLVPKGECDFQIEEILLQEQPIYRWVRLIAFLLLFALVDCVGYCLLVEPAVGAAEFLRRHETTVLLGLVCLFACLPFFHDGLLHGDDLDFHLVRIAHLAQCLQEGQFPVRLYTDMLNGYGYAAPLYYCDIFLYIPALLYNCMLPLQTCYKVYGILVTVATAATCYVSLQHIFGEKKISAAGTVIYLLAGYRLSNVFARAAVGEYTAMIWLPLVVWGMYKIYAQKKPTWHDWTPLAVGMSGLVLCHVISFEITCVFLVIFCLASLRSTLHLPRLAAIFKAAGLCVALCAWFLVPMLYSITTQKILGTQALPTDFQASGVSLYELLVPFPAQKQDSPLGTLGASLIIGALIAAFVLLQRDSWKSIAPKTKRLLQYSLLLGCMAAVFALNRFPWNSLLSYVEGTLAHKMVALAQFPWRYLTVGTILLTVAASAALYILRQQRPDWYRAAQGVVLVTAVLYSCLFYYNLFQSRKEEIRYTPIVRDENAIGMAEYKLEGTVDLNYARPQSDNDALLIKWYDKTDGVAHITLENTSDEEAAVVLPIYNYGAYYAEDMNGVEWTLSGTENSLLQIVIPGEYSGSISVWYKEPLLWRGSELVSLAAWGTLIAGGLTLRKRKKR